MSETTREHAIRVTRTILGADDAARFVAVSCQVEARIVLEEAVRGILDEAESREDVRDGSGGRRPNAWMEVATRCRDALRKAGLPA